MTTTLTQAWLRQAITPYSGKDRLYSDVDSVLANCPTLRPKTDVYTFDDGREHLLLCLHGLLPISFRQATYNIPVALWFPLNYPKEPPLTYVVPTGDMLVKSSQEVDVSGRCHLQYLTDWGRKSEAATLRGLIEVMQDTFSRDPPVYAKPKSAHVSPPPSLPTSRSASSAIVGPSQVDHPHQRSIASSNQLQDSGAPALPAKPGTQHGPLSYPLSPGTFSPLPGNASASLVVRPPPPLPGQHTAPQPASTHALLPQVPERPPPPPWAHPLSLARQPTSTSPQPPPVAYGPSHQQSRSLSSSTSSTPPHFTASPHNAQSPPLSPPAPPRPPYAQQWAPYSPVHTSSVAPNPMSSQTSYQQSPSTSVQSPGPPPPPVLQNPPVIALAPAPPLPIHHPNFIDSEEDIDVTNTTSGTASLVPARPPNPELLHLYATLHQNFNRELASLNEALSGDSERLRATQGDLLAGEPAIRDEMARLVAVRDVCKSVATRVKTVVEAADSNVNELRKKGDPEVDELICSTTIVYNQLVDLVAEDNAIEDTMYHLHRALNAGRIDIDRYIRTTRVLAEEQFKKRALIEKITSGIPMGAAIGQW